MKIGFVSLGCPKNLVDTEVMLGLVEQAGHTLTADAAEAEVIVVNTCAFIDRAKEESIQTILEMAEHRRRGSCRRLVVTGCLAERYRDELRAEIPEIDVVLGTGEVPAIVGAVAGAARPATPVEFWRGRPATPPADRREGPAGPARPLPGYLAEGVAPRVLATPRHYAYLKVAEGCDYACAFCIIPKLRGPYRSRSMEAIEREARILAERGVRELLLVSQDTSFYGRDRGERDLLARLLRRLDTIDGLAWIRVLYLYPTTITDEMLAAMAECEKVCKYVDLPLQHVSRAVLARMRRPGDGATYARLIDRIRTRLPGVALRTTFIVGFPGETHAEFAELCQFLRDTQFDHVGVFTYSHEEGTAAFALSDDVPPAEKRRRRAALLGLQQRLVAQRQRQRIGQRTRLMVDGPSPESPLVLQGRLASQAPEIDSLVYLTDCDPTAYRPGDLIDVELVDARGYDLVARPLGLAPTAQPSHQGGRQGALVAGSRERVV
jgi:ribosomal protein S12 methylthiotransferase